MKATSGFRATLACFHEILTVTITFMIPFTMLLACASKPKGRTILAGGVSVNLLILPLNVTRPLPQELEGLSSAVWRELESYLGTEGKRLKTVNPVDARHLWISSVHRTRSVGKRADFGDSVRALVLELTQHAEFDTVLIPSLFVREAPISGDKVIWDGVERSLEFRRAGRVVESSSVDTSFEGAAPVSSLRILVLDVKGEKIQDATGGLEPLVFVRVGGSGLKFAPRKRIDGNSENIREGVTEALSPYFLPPRRPRKK